MPLPFQRRGGAHLRPTFSRDFAGLKTLDHGTGPAITFTRASGATYFDANGVLQTASNDVPRFDHDPATGNASRGLLIEESRTNSLIYSADLGDAAWTKELGATVTTNTATAPDGTVSGDTITFSATNANRVQQTAGAAVDAQTWTFSVWLKGTGTARILVDSSTGVGGSGELNITLTSTWTRYSVSVTYSSPTGNRRAAIIWRTGNTATSVDAWGAQLEQGAFPTSYIPTTTAAATRSADSAVVTPISSFYNQSEGTLFAEFSRPQVTNSGTVVFVTKQGNAGRHTTISTAAAAQRFIARDSAAQIIAQLTVNSNTANTVYKGAAGYKTDDFVYSQNGAAVLTDTSGAIDTGYDRFVIGAYEAVQQLNGHIRKIAYYPRRLSNTLLEQLTT